MRSFNLNNSVIVPESSIFSILTTSSNILHFFLIIPFKLFLHKDRLGVKSNGIQKLACLVLHAITLASSLKSMCVDVITVKVSKNIAENPGILANKGNLLISVICMWYFIGCIWIPSKPTKTFFFNVWNNFPFPPRKLKFTGKVTTVLIFFVSTLLILGNAITRFFVSGPQAFDLISNRWETKLGIPTEIRKSEIIYLVWLYQIFTIVLYIYYYIITWLSTLFYPCFVCCIFYKIGSDTEKVLSENLHCPVEFVTKLYSSTEVLIANVNKTTGVSLILGTISALFSFSYAILIMINPLASLTIKLNQSITVVLFLVCFGLAAEGGCKLRFFNEFLFKNRKNPGYKDNLEVTLLLSKKPLCLRAFKFDVTYGFLVNNMSVVLTYGIVFLQFQLNSEDSK